MGNQQIQLILLVLIILFLVSLLSSVDGRQNFAKITRKLQTVENVVEAKQSTVETAAVEPPPPQPLFYQQSKEDNNPHGLNKYTHNNPTHPPPPPPPPHTPSKSNYNPNSYYVDSPPHTHNTPPPPPTYTHSPPSKYNPHYYVTQAGRQDLPPSPPPHTPMDQPKIIEDSDDDHLLNDEDEDELFDTESDIDDESQYYPTTPKGQRSNYANTNAKYGPASRHYNPTSTTKPNYAPTQFYGMSDTTKFKNGKYHYDLRTESFTHSEHPYNQLANYNQQNNNPTNYYPTGTTTTENIDPLDVNEEDNIDDEP